VRAFIQLLCLLYTTAGCQAAAPEATTSRILSYNIKHGLGMDGKLDLKRTAETIRKLDPRCKKPDFLLLVALWGLGSGAG